MAGLALFSWKLLSWSFAYLYKKSIKVVTCQAAGRGKTIGKLQKIKTMKRKIAVMCLLFSFLISFGQEQYFYKFEKIEAIDTIHQKDTINSVLNSERLYKGRFLISYYKNSRIPSFYIKEKNYLLCLDLGFSDETNYNIIDQSENGQYIYINEDGNHSVTQSGFENKYLHIIDIKNMTYISLQYYSSVTHWEPRTDDPGAFNIITEHTVNSSKIRLNKNGLTVADDFYTINDSAKVDYDVIRAGEYEFDKHQLKKTKFYDTESMRLKPIKYIGNIAIGMTLEDLLLVYPNADFQEKENLYTTCANEAGTGFEVWDDNELLGFVNHNIGENKITDFKAISPKFNFGKINTNTNAREILKLYPKSNVRLDSLTEWEHIFIKELNIELVFKTNENNRIGNYKNEKFINLKNGKAKADFIQVN
ncbi:MAG: hypothetical protein ABIQ27_02320 [Flavobacterium sp.]|uniref:hypothetical protein n=1 Tax=Flavobacterium sp. TaxID=239 RepID=UPI00326459BE